MALERLLSVRQDIRPRRVQPCSIPQALYRRWKRDRRYAVACRASSSRIDGVDLERVYDPCSKSSYGSRRACDTCDDVPSCIRDGVGGHNTIGRCSPRYGYAFAARGRGEACRFRGGEHYLFRYQGLSAPIGIRRLRFVREPEPEWVLRLPRDTCPFNEVEFYCPRLPTSGEEEARWVIHVMSSPKTTFLFVVPDNAQADGWRGVLQGLGNAEVRKE